MRGAREWGQRRGTQAGQGLPYFNELLEGQPFLAGPQFSMADITLFAALSFADGIAMPIDAGLAVLAAWRRRVAALPAVINRSGQALRPEDIARRGA